MITTFLPLAAGLTLTNGTVLGLAPGTNMVVTDLKGWISPAGIRRNKTDRLWAHGSFTERGWKDERLISMSGHIEAGTRNEAAGLTDTLAAVLADGTVGTFTVTDADLGTRSAGVVLTGTPTVDWDSGVEIDFSIDMIASDPRKYGPAVSGQTGPAAPGGGLGWNLFTQNTLGILDFGAVGTPGTVTIINRGKADTPPTFTVAGYAPGFTITELATQSRLVYTATVLAGSQLVLSAADGSVLLDGTGDRSIYLSVRQWTTIPGGSSSTFLFESAGATGATLTVGASPAWW